MLNNQRAKHGDTIERSLFLPLYIINIRIYIYIYIYISRRERSRTEWLRSDFQKESGGPGAILGLPFPYWKHQETGWFWGGRAWETRNVGVDYIFLLQIYVYIHIYIYIYIYIYMYIYIYIYVYFLEIHTHAHMKVCDMQGEVRSSWRKPSHGCLT